MKMLGQVLILSILCYAAQVTMVLGYHSPVKGTQPQKTELYKPKLDYNTAYVVDLMLCYSINGYPCKGTPGKYYNHISCLSKDQVCDGITQCPYGDDESGACGPLSVFCRSEQIRCGDGHCANQCDGIFDCMNNEDERGCPKEEKFKCDKKQIMCSDFSCAMVCDGKKECPFGEDEMNCLPQCKKGIEKYCRENNKCILKTKKCPGELCDVLDIYETIVRNRCAIEFDGEDCVEDTVDEDDAHALLACIDGEKDTLTAESYNSLSQYRGCTSRIDLARCMCLGKADDYTNIEHCVSEYYYLLQGAKCLD